LQTGKTQSWASKRGTGVTPPWILKCDIFSKKSCFLSFERGKLNFTLLSPGKNLFVYFGKNSLLALPWKNPSDTNEHNENLVEWQKRKVFARLTKNAEQFCGRKGGKF